MMSNVNTDKIPTPERSPTREHNFNIKDEPPEGFLDELLAELSKEKEATSTAAEVKPEANTDTNEENDDEEIDPAFFDDILKRAEEERSLQRSTSSGRTCLKREHVDQSENNRGEDQSSTQLNAKRPRLKVRSDLCLLSSTEKEKPNEVPSNEIAESKATVEPPKLITFKEKLCQVLERIMYAKKAFASAQNQKEKIFYPNKHVFLYTPTVHKLPSSHTRFTQQLYDNRSPLHTVNNVSFKFNSISTRHNLKEWGLETLSRKAKEIAYILGFDVEALLSKREKIKIPIKLKKAIQKDATVSAPSELCVESNSTLFINAIVQTDEVRILPVRRRDYQRDVGVQFAPYTEVCGTQTSAAYIGPSGADLPLFKTIRGLNENQLQALDDFVQLILEPIDYNSSIDVFNQRQRLNNVYKMSQIPCERPLPNTADLDYQMPPAPPPPSINDFNHDYTSVVVKKEQDAHNSRFQRPGVSHNFLHRGGNLDQASRRGGRDNWNQSAPKFYGRGSMRR